MAAALSFLPVQLCVWLEVIHIHMERVIPFSSISPSPQIQAFFKRFQSPAEKSRVVPGLQELRKPNSKIPPT
jgi:hypothetical protein